MTEFIFSDTDMESAMRVYDRAITDPSRTMARIVQIYQYEKNQNSDSLYIARFANKEGLPYAWQCVTKTNYNVGDKCIYIEIDSVLHPQYLFAQELYKNGVNRIKTIKLRGELSQGMLISLDVLPKDVQNVEVDDDVTTILQIRKYVSPSEANEYGMSGENVKSLPIGGDIFPGSIRKTDENRLQNMPRVIKDLANRKIVITQKEDGTSATYTTTETCVDGQSKTEHCVCGRNIQWDENAEGGKIYWQMYRKYGGLAELLNVYPDYAIQGEIVGPSIQGNKLKLKELEFHIFNIQRKNQQTYLSHQEVTTLCKKYKLSQVKEIFVGANMEVIDFVNKTVKSNFTEINANMFIALASALKYPGNTPAEGIVIKTEDEGFRVSVKVISPEFLLKQKD